MESKNLGYSLKNIPIPSKASYLKSMIDKVENFIKRIRWKAHFFDNPMMRNNDSHTNYCLRSNILPSQNPALTSFENDIYDILRSIEFRKVCNDFQDKLKEDINEICSSKNLFVFAAKSNQYKMSDTDYNRRLSDSIPSNYRKCENSVKHKTDKETKK